MKKDEEKERVKNIARFLMNPTMDKLRDTKINKEYPKPNIKKEKINE